MNEQNRHDLNDLTHHHLSALEARTLASNLERIEMERERIKNPTELDYVGYLLLGLFALVVIAYVAWNMLAYCDNVFGFLFYLILGIGAVWIDLKYIRACWFEITGK